MPESEPTPWELMRMMREVRDAVNTMSANMLTVAMFKIYQESADRRFAEMDRDILDEKAARAKEVGKVEARIEEQDKFKRGVWASIGLAAFVALLGLVLSLVRVGPS